MLQCRYVTCTDVLFRNDRVITQPRPFSSLRALDTDVCLPASDVAFLFWDNFSPDGRPVPVSSTFADHVNRLIAEVDQETQQ